MESTFPIPAGVPTRLVHVARGAVARLGDALTHVGIDTGVGCLVVDDRRTRAAAGERVAAALHAAGHPVEHLTLTDDANGEIPGDMAQVAQVQRACGRAGGIGVVIGVGSGVLNDLGKLAARRTGTAYVAVATAASMNGYGSPIAAIVEAGIKRTLPAAATTAIVADLDILAAAPLDMTRSGFADALSKASATADWNLAHLVRGEPYDDRPHALLDPVVRRCQDRAASIGRAQPRALALLMETLVCGAFAMTLAGHSAPASGGEHLVSHLWDMQAHAARGRHALHGFQVALGTRVVAALYQRLMWTPAADIDVDRLAERWRPWEQVRESLRHVHGELFTAIEPEARKQHLARRALRDELVVIRDRWDEVREALLPLLLTPDDLRTLHERAGVPLAPTAVGQSRASVRHALLHAKDVRARFTVLDLAHELGVLEAWADEVLDDAGIGE